MSNTVPSALHRLALGLVVAGFSAAAAAQGNTAEPADKSRMAAAARGVQPGMAVASAADKTFVDQAAAGGMAEVALGQLAQDKGTSDVVKQFGKHMVDDHTKANDELKQIASGKGMSLPPEPTPAQRATQARLEKMSGPAFDRAYMDVMVADHKKTVALFRKEAKSGKDAGLKGFAAKTLPTLEEHTKQAMTTQAAVHQAMSAGKTAKASS